MKLFIANVKTMLVRIGKGSLFLFKWFLILCLLALASVIGKELTKGGLPFVSSFFKSNSLNWQQRFLAGIILETPYNLNKAALELPPLVKDLALLSEAYQSPDADFQIVLCHLCYKPGLTLSLQGAVTGILNTLPSKVDSPISILDTMGVLISGYPAIEFNTLTTFKERPIKIRGIAIQKNTDMWLLSVSYGKSFYHGDQHARRLLRSIEISPITDNVHDSIMLAAIQNAKLDSKDIAKVAYPSVVMLLTADSIGTMRGLGSGFYISQDMIVTNYHVIRGADSAVANPVGSKERIAIKGFVAIDTAHDLAILQTDTANGSWLPVDSCWGTAIGEEIYAIGNPEGLKGTISSGIVSAIRGTAEDTLYQITAPISQGSSGGPVISSNARVVGIAVGIYKTGQNLNFAIPSCYLNRLLAQLSAPLPLRLATIVNDGSNISPNIASEDTSTPIENSKPITAATLIWDINSTLSWLQIDGVKYSFSLNNNTDTEVRNIEYIVKFYDISGAIIETEREMLYQPIPPHMAKRVYGKVKFDIFQLSVDYTTGYNEIERIDKSRIRVEITKYDPVY